MPDKKGDHTEPENKEKESQRSLHLDTITTTSTFRKFSHGLSGTRMCKPREPVVFTNASR